MCSDVFINMGGHHIVARTFDFLVNLALQDKIGFIGDENTTDVILDADQIPAMQLVSWENKYGYFGRAAFNGEKIVDGMNTEGFSVALLYLPGTKYPAYDPKNKKQVIATYDIAPFLLAQAQTVSEALHLVRSYQWVQSAVKYIGGVFIKDLPIHCVIRDKIGESAVIEFIDGQVKIYENSGDILTNAPTFDWQLKNASHYDSLLANNEKPNELFSKNFYEYDTIYKKVSHKGEANLLGTPGDFTPPSRFARAKVLLNNFPTPTSKQMALYQANALIESLAVPVLKGAAPTLWCSIKDLDDMKYYVKILTLFQGKKTLVMMPITNTYVLIDLKAIDFNDAEPEYARMKVHPTNPNNVKKIISEKNVTVPEIE
ncbi:MAG: linear amide C-N hydrolase [Alphaproteobacteria bacterium]|nr:linear amide C-N hydrolase [Alphaproteobacteria bacterium]